LPEVSSHQESQDAGKTWSNSMADIWRIVSEKGFPALMQLGIRSELNHFVADAKESEKFYGTAVPRSW
jgi:hypothetical protein